MTRSSATSRGRRTAPGIAYESSAGVTVSRFTKFEAGDCAAPNDFVLSATGTSPDWGPADPPAAAYTPPVVTPDPGTARPTR